MSYRMDNWMANTGVRNNYLLNSTGVNNTGCCGGSNAVNTALGIFNVALGVTTTAMTAKAQANATNAAAEQSALTKATSGVTAGIQNYTTAKLQYETANKELSDLQARKNGANDQNIGKLESEISALKGAYQGSVDGTSSQNDGLQAKYNAVQSEIKTLESQKSQLTSLQGVIADNKDLAAQNNSGNIGNSGITVSYTGDAGSDAGLAAKTLEGAKGNSRYNKANPEYKPGCDESVPKTIFMQALYDADMQKANEMDAQQQKTIAAKNAVTRAEADIKKLGLPEGATPESIDEQIKNKENELASISNTNMTGTSGDEKGATLSFGQYSAKLEGLEKELAKAKADKNDTTLDQKIKKKTEEVNAKESKMESAKTSLLNLKAQLFTQKQQMESLSSDSSIKSAKEQYKTAKQADHRNFFQKMLGTGKSQDTKDAKQAYKDMKSKQKENNNTFTALNGYSANKANISQIEAQINMIDNALKATTG